jgi:hypothetical protein
LSFNFCLLILWICYLARYKSSLSVIGILGLEISNYYPENPIVNLSYGYLARYKSSLSGIGILGLEISNYYPENPIVNLSYGYLAR